MVVVVVVVTPLACCRTSETNGEMGAVVEEREVAKGKDETADWCIADGAHTFGAS